MKIRCTYYDRVEDKYTGFIYEPKKEYDIEDEARGAELIESGYFEKVVISKPVEEETTNEEDAETDEEGTTGETEEGNADEEGTEAEGTTTTTDEGNVDYSKMTVAELKEVAAEKNIDVEGMKKEQIIEALTK